MNAIIDALHFRQACKIFDPCKNIAPTNLDTLFEAAVLKAPGYRASGQPPWQRHSKETLVEIR